MVAVGGDAGSDPMDLGEVVTGKDQGWSSGKGSRSLERADGVDDAGKDSCRARSWQWCRLEAARGIETRAHRCSGTMTAMAVLGFDKKEPGVRGPVEDGTVGFSRQIRDWKEGGAVEINQRRQMVEAGGPRDFDSGSVEELAMGRSCRAVVARQRRRRHNSSGAAQWPAQDLAGSRLLGCVTPQSKNKNT